MKIIYSKSAKPNGICIILEKCNLPKEIQDGIENLKIHIAIKEIELLFKIPYKENTRFRRFYG